MDYSNFSGHQSQSFPLYGLSTPDHKPPQNPDEALRDPFALNTFNQYFPGYESSLRIDPSSFVPPHSPPDSFTKHSAGSSDHANFANHDQSMLDGDDLQFADPAAARSSSEEKDSSVPAQSKRKAQNRAAQRAFRERKERHLKELEEKVLSLEEASNNLEAENERLKRELAKYATENEILRATSALNGGGNNNTDHSAPTTVNGPMIFTPTDFYSKLADGEEWATTMKSHPMTHRLLFCKTTGEKLLDVGETWDMIQADQSFKEGLVDIALVVKHLKGVAQCSGQGPAFKESDIKKAITATVSDRDELI